MALASAKALPYNIIYENKTKTVRKIVFRTAFGRLYKIK
jgi:hypothetical protein